MEQWWNPERYQLNQLFDHCQGDLSENTSFYSSIWSPLGYDLQINEDQFNNLMWNRIKKNSAFLKDAVDFLGKCELELMNSMKVSHKQLNWIYPDKNKNVHINLGSNFQFFWQRGMYIYSLDSYSFLFLSKI